MVGILSPFLLGFGLFSGAKMLLVSGKVKWLENGVGVYQCHFQVAYIIIYIPIWESYYSHKMTCAVSLCFLAVRQVTFDPQVALTQSQSLAGFESTNLQPCQRRKERGPPVVHPKGQWNDEFILRSWEIKQWMFDPSTFSDTYHNIDLPGAWWHDHGIYLYIISNIWDPALRMAEITLKIKTLAPNLSASRMPSIFKNELIIYRSMTIPFKVKHFFGFWKTMKNLRFDAWCPSGLSSSRKCV